MTPPPRAFAPWERGLGTAGVRVGGGGGEGDDGGGGRC